MSSNHMTIKQLSYGKPVKKWLVERYGVSEARKIWQQTKRNYRTYLKDLPDYGGSKNGHASAISSWMITASTNQRIISLTRDLLHNYWAHHDRAVHYFIIHLFFQMAIEAYPDDWKKVVPVPNSLPHILLLRLFEPYDERIWEQTKKLTSFHKLSYKFEQKNTELPGTFFSEILK